MPGIEYTPTDAGPGPATAADELPVHPARRAPLPDIAPGAGPARRKSRRSAVDRRRDTKLDVSRHRFDVASHCERPCRTRHRQGRHRAGDAAGPCAVHRRVVRARQVRGGSRCRSTPVCAATCSRSQRRSLPGGAEPEMKRAGQRENDEGHEVGEQRAMKTIRTTTIAAALIAMVMMTCVSAAVAAGNAQGLKASVEQGMERLVGAVIEAVGRIEASSEGESEEAVRAVVEDIRHAERRRRDDRTADRRQAALGQCNASATRNTDHDDWAMDRHDVRADDRRIQRRSRGAGPRGNADGKREGADKVRNHDRWEGDKHGVRAGDRPSGRTDG